MLCFCGVYMLRINVVRPHAEGMSLHSDTTLPAKLTLSDGSRGECVMVGSLLGGEPGLDYVDLIEAQGMKTYGYLPRLSGHIGWNHNVKLGCNPDCRIHDAYLFREI